MKALQALTFRAEAQEQQTESNNKKATMPKAPDVIKTGSEGAICHVKAFILNNPKNMRTLIEILKLSEPLKPATKQQAILELKIFKYAGVPARRVPNSIFEAAGTDVYPNLTGDVRTLYSGTPISAGLPLVQNFLKEFVVPVVDDEARLTSPEARVAIEAAAKEQNLRSGGVNVMQEEPVTVAAVLNELNEARSKIESLTERLIKWKNEALAKHKAMVLWQAYALIDEDETTPANWAQVNINYDAPIQYPPLADPVGGVEGAYGLGVPLESVYQSPMKKRRITFVNEQPKEGQPEVA